MSIPEIRFHVTGFGPFQGVDNNPTKRLMEKMPQVIANAPVLISSAKVLSWDVFETSAVGALGTLAEIMQTHKTSQVRENSESSGATVFLHFGVNSRASDFALEKVAYNDASFRCPDERGWQPCYQPIINSHPLLSPLSTRIPLPLVAAQLKELGFPVKMSEDPGRFLCNYIYYQSLHFSRINNTYSMFVHIPPFESISEEIQLTFVVAVINVITKILLASPNVNNSIDVKEILEYQEQKRISLGGNLEILSQLGFMEKNRNLFALLHSDGKMETAFQILSLSSFKL